METTAPVDDVLRILQNDHHDPFAVLGAHIITDSGNTPMVVIRAFLPDARAAWVIANAPDGQERNYPMTRVHERGFFEAGLQRSAGDLPLQTAEGNAGWGECGFP